MAGGGEGPTLEFTPTWVVAVVCTVIVGISLAAERALHSGGKYLKRKKQKPLYEALLKVKEELMLLGFISLLLTVFQNRITKICVKPEIMDKWLPCSLDHNDQTNEDVAHFSTSLFGGIAGYTRRLLAAGGEAQQGYCGKKHKVPLLSVEAFHHLHIFIFVLAIVHVTFCALTIVFGGLKIHQWKKWEDEHSKEINEADEVQVKITHVQEHDFVKDHFWGIGKNYRLMGWLHSFLNQFFRSVTRSDYLTLRLGFITTHCKGNPKFNFHTYMVRALEDDFKRVVGISWYLWIFVVLFMLMNVDGWHAYFWIAFVPFFLLLAVGTKLQHVITQLAHEVAEKHIAIEGELIVQPSDEHFWFGKPKFVLFLIHFILFQNAFEMAFFFWIWVQYGFTSCIMGKVKYIIPRIVIGVFIQVLCSYSTLPLYAIVTQMGSNFKKAIFDEDIRLGLVGWAKKARRRKASIDASSSGTGSDVGVQLGKVNQKTTTKS
ncbi:MLO-like protein 1 [Prunus avium]|uniref:MLO-like protein n=1 Tax=Prunus avium TaxID=42229 RepID=A0A6P5SHT2_PRUAV|nr:MLO-like protein 1 [Prunus avium]